MLTANLKKITSLVTYISTKKPPLTNCSTQIFSSTPQNPQLVATIEIAYPRCPKESLRSLLTQQWTVFLDQAILGPESRTWSLCGRKEERLPFSRSPLHYSANWKALSKPQAYTLDSSNIWWRRGIMACKMRFWALVLVVQAATERLERRWGCQDSCWISWGFWRLSTFHATAHLHLTSSSAEAAGTILLPDTVWLTLNNFPISNRKTVNCQR